MMFSALWCDRTKRLNEKKKGMHCRAIKMLK